MYLYPDAHLYSCENVPVTVVSTGRWDMCGIFTVVAATTPPSGFQTSFAPAHCSRCGEWMGAGLGKKRSWGGGGDPGDREVAVAAVE